MSKAINGKRRVTRLTLAATALAALGACSEGEGLNLLQTKDKEGAASATRASIKPTKLIERDVEAPDVFAATEAGLWDGRPSLGGVWVAHPDVKDPERVVIRNSANGKDVIGALFRRERDIPGPRLQASSDAAVALGMLAGAPVKLEVIALRREEIAPAPPAVAETPAEAATVPQATEVAEATLDPVAGAAAAIDASEVAKAAPDADPEIKPKKRFSLFKRREAPAETEALAEAAEPESRPEAGTVLAEADTAPPAPKKRFSLFKRKDKPAIAALAAPDDTAPAAAPGADPQAEAIAAAVAEAAPDARPSAQPRKRWFGAGLFARKQADEDVGPPLSALAPDEVHVASADITASPLPKAAPRKSSLAKPYVQIGIFSVEANANTTAAQMRKNGVVPTVFEQKSDGKTFWRVVVGPARSGSERGALLKKVKGIGYSDAYAVTN